MSLKAKVNERMPFTSEQIVYQYFKYIDSKDLGGILDLFDYDATVYEPFSNMKGGLKGRSSIEPFLKVAMMANSDLRRKIKIENISKPNGNRVVALITFERGEKVKGRFTFGFEDDPAGGKKIKSLRIEFL